MVSKHRIDNLLKRLEKRATRLFYYTFITICDTWNGKKHIDYDYFTFKNTGELMEIDKEFYKRDPSITTLFVRMGLVNDDGKVGLGFIPPDSSLASNVVKNPQLKKRYG